MKFKQWLVEMPIVNLQRLGDWEPDKKSSAAYDNRRSAKKGYYKDDFGILTNDFAVEKIKRKWSKCEQPFNTFFLRSKEGAKQREVGLVDINFLKETLKLSDQDIKQIDNPSAINIVFTNNIGAERMPMNWWTMAHRVGHAIFRFRKIPEYDYFIKQLNHEMRLLLERVYNYNNRDEKALLSLANGIGSMKSARDKTIRNIFEFYHELTAQYIIQGKVTFRPFPEVLVTHHTYGRPQGRRYDLDEEDIEGWNDYLSDHLAPEVDSNIGYALEKCIGKIFVM